MFNYDIARYTKRQRSASSLAWATERSHESYAKNYSIVFPNDQPLAGRNFTKDPLHDEMMKYGAVMEEKQGWERPGYFRKESKPTVVQPYDWYGNYGHSRNEDTMYEDILKNEYRFGFSENHNLVSKIVCCCADVAWTMKRIHCNILCLSYSPSDRTRSECMPNECSRV